MRVFARGTRAAILHDVARAATNAQCAIGSGGRSVRGGGQRIIQSRAGPGDGRRRPADHRRAVLGRCRVGRAVRMVSAPSTSCPRASGRLRTMGRLVQIRGVAMWTLGSRGWCERLAPWNGGPLPPGMRADERGNRHGPGLPLRRPSSRRASGSGGVRVFDTTIRRGALGPVSAVGARRARRSPCRPCRGQSVGRRARRRGERSDKGLVTLGSRRRRPADRDQRSCAIRAAPRSCAIGSAADRTYRPRHCTTFWRGGR